MALIRTATLFLLLPALLVAAGPMTVRDYVAMPTLQSPRFSPDGKRIVYVLQRADLERSTYEADLWLVEVEGGQPLQLTQTPAVDRQPRWSPDGKRISFLSERDGEAELYLIAPAGGESVRLTDEPTAVRSHEWSSDGTRIAFLRLDPLSPEMERRIAAKDDARLVGEEQRQVHLHVIDLADRKVLRLTAGNYSVLSFEWSADGRSILFDRGPGPGLDDLYRSNIHRLWLADRKVEPVVERPGADRFPLPSPDGRWIAFRSTGGWHDWLREQALYLASADGSAPRMISTAYDRSPESVTWSPDSRQLYFEGPWNTTTQLFRVNADGTGFTSLSGSDGLVEEISIHFPSRRFAFVYQTLQAPPEIHTSTLDAWRPMQLTHHNAEYRQRQLGQTRLIRWKNPKDGMEIEGLLTLPLGYVSGKRYPLLTFIHGGPASRFDQGYLGYLGYIYPPHVLAARGFAVFRPNPRGTGAYGEAFRRANRNDWGGMDWLDINAGIDAVIDQGIADPDRLGVMGWSYGGFLSAWAIARSDRFKAISIGAPISDLLSYHGTSDIRDFVASYFPPGEEIESPLVELRSAPLSPELLRARSPLWHLRRIKAPILIQHGEADLRVPLSQGLMLYRLLEELGNDVTMVLYPRTPHTPREPKLRIDVGRRNVEFFERHLKPQ